MKIALIGEYSGFHNNLAFGLRHLGHSVTIAADGDGWKGFSFDRPFLGSKKFGNLGRLKIFLSFLYAVRGFDVVQVISLVIIPNQFLMLVLTLWLRIFNRRVFFAAVGCDSLYFFGAKDLPYSPCNTCQKLDLRKTCGYSKKSSLLSNILISKFSAGTIPGAIDYQLTHSKFIKTTPMIPFPGFPEKSPKVDWESKRKKLKDRITILHGINRAGFKGSDLIITALDSIKAEYGDRVIIKQVKHLSITAYIEEVANADIIVDQTWSLSYGMNGLLAMGLGKVVLSGNEAQFTSESDISDSPVINILPKSSSIRQTIVELLDNVEMIIALSQRGEVFARTDHDQASIARRYLAAWLSKS